MQQPTFTANQFVDALSFNNAMSGIAANSREYGLLFGLTGLSNPSVITIGVAGLVANSTLPAPFGVLFGDGTLARAHGTLSNADTQSYATSFSGIAPATGSITGYLLASLVYINQNPVQIIGPPPGHPDYDPTFVPFTAYLDSVASLNLFASSGAADNINTFELARYTVTHTSLTSGTTAFQNVLTLLPTGMLMDFSAPAAPAGWLACDGSAVSRTAYSKLNALAAQYSYAAPYGAGDGVTTFNVPDFRGYFARGWDSSGVVDPGRTFGTTQTDKVGPHIHPVPYQGNNSGDGGPGHGGGGFSTNSPSETFPNVDSGSSTETRPKNIAVLTCVKT